MGTLKAGVCGGLTCGRTAFELRLESTVGSGELDPVGGLEKLTEPWGWPAEVAVAEEVEAARVPEALTDCVKLGPPLVMSKEPEGVFVAGLGFTIRKRPRVGSA